MDEALVATKVEVPRTDRQRRRSTMASVAAAVVLLCVVVQLAAFLSYGSLVRTQVAVLSGALLLATGATGAAVTRLQNPWYAAILVGGFMAVAAGLLGCALLADIDEVRCF